MSKLLYVPISALLLLIAIAPVTAAQEELPKAPFFSNVTDDVGLTGTSGFRLSVADLNGDGYPDILLHKSLDPASGDVLDKQYLYLNLQGDPPEDPFSRQFVDFTTESNVRANRAGSGSGRHSDSAIFADVDNDGDLDIFTLVYLHRTYTLNLGTNELLLNDGDAHFTLAPNSPFHLEPIHNTAGAVFMDYDLDGNIDLFIGNWYFNEVLSTDQLYQGAGDGSFANVTSASGIGSATTSIYGLAAWDWNDDGFPDLFAPSYSHTAAGATPRHWMNNGNGTFSQVQVTSHYSDYGGYGSGIASFGSMPRDYDNDGDIDFLEVMTHGYGDGAGGVHSTTVTNVDGVYSWDFYRVDGRGSEDADTTHHGDHYASWFDFDNDGLCDFALTESGYDNNGFYLFKQAAGNTFSPFTVASGLNAINVAGLPPHNAIALDYDLDGDEDLLVGFGNDTDGIQLWRNDYGNRINNWIVVTLEGGGGGHGNRAAIGARVEVIAGGNTYTRVVRAGDGHHGPQFPLRLIFGLGHVSIVDSITVHWPNAAQTTDILTDLAVDQSVTIQEICFTEDDPSGLLLDKDGSDVLMTWIDPAVSELVWNVYREDAPDTLSWGAPHAAGVTDEDPVEEGIQYRDVGAMATGSLHCYLVTAVNECGESPLR